MSEHRATVRWQNNGPGLDYDHFSRDHTWAVKEGRLTVPVSAAPAYKGNPDLLDPEDALVGALASCHMLTFLAIAARRRLVVEDYADAAVGWLEPDAEGRLALTRVELRPVVRFAPVPPLSEEEYLKLHDKAHRGCFIANSVKTEITCIPQLAGKGAGP
jgi:organic hydroperoxide reductase OsmC/OhrA